MLPELKYSTQLHFFNLVEKPEFKVVGRPTRTINDFWHSDVYDTADYIRNVYIPNYQEEDREAFAACWDWLKDKGDISKMAEMSFSDFTDENRPPVFVLANIKTAVFITSEGNYLKKKNNHGFEPSVAYTPGTRRLKNDVRNLTLPYFERLKLLHYEPGTNNDSTTRRIAVNAEFFRCGGTGMGLKRFEAIDNLTSELLMRYYLVLSRRNDYKMNKMDYL